MTEENNQEFLKKLDKVDETGKRIVNRIMIILYAVFTVVALSLTVYYGVLVIQGNDNTKQFVSAFILLLLLGAIPLCYKLFDLVFCYFFKKDTTYDPGTAVLPVPGTVTLEDALHKMSSQVGVIVWDSLWGVCIIQYAFPADLRYRGYGAYYFRLDGSGGFYGGRTYRTVLYLEKKHPD